MTTLFYSMVARVGGGGGRAVVLSEFTTTTGNQNIVARKILDKVPPADAKLTYTYDDKHVFHILVEGGVIFMCMCGAHPEGKRRIPFAFLEDIQRSYRSKYAERYNTATPNEVFEQFAPTLQERMTYYSGDPQLDKVAEVRSHIEDVKSTMVQNVDSILQRGEKITLLIKRTEEMAQESYTFKQQTTELKRMMWWKNMKLTLIIAIPCLIGLFWLIVFACGGITFKNCSGGGGGGGGPAPPPPSN